MTPASEMGADRLIGPELVAELAASARLVPLVHPVDAAPEPRYVSSKALADFVRCRDLTCRTSSVTAALTTKQLPSNLAKRG